MSTDVPRKIARAALRVIKSVPGIQGERFEARPDIVYVHIPKCGGTSLLSAIAEFYGPEDRMQFDIVHHYHEAMAAHKPKDRDDWQRIWMTYRQNEFEKYMKMNKGFVYGHMPMSADLLDGFASNYHFFTVFRDPIDRFISNYIFDKVAGGIRIPDVLPQEDSSISAELDLYLASREAYWLAREQLIMIAGLDEEGSLDDTDMLKRAKQNLKRYKLVGFTEQMDEFEESFSATFDLDLKIGRLNQTSDFFSKGADIRKAYYEAFDHSVRERVATLCAAEYELYQHAQSSGAFDAT